MDEPPSAMLLLLMVLVVLSSFFSGSEAALLSIGRAKVRALKESGKRGAWCLEHLKRHPKKLIITILIGNNIVNVLLPVLATVVATHQFGDHVLGIVTGILTLILLIFGEIIPKNVGQLYSERFSLIAAPILYGLSYVLFPVVWVFEKLSDLMVSKKSHDPITEDEVLAMVSLGAEGGAIEQEERELIENVLEFTDTTAEQVMIPRIDMEVMEGTTTLGEAVEFFISHTHSRIPVYQENIDQITGIITIKQTLKSWRQYEEDKLIKNLELKTPLFVPITKKIADIFRMFQQSRMHMAIVVDEHGGTAGIITMEDILEEVFGEITDESDDDAMVIRKLSDTSWSVPGNIELEDISSDMGLDLGDDTEAKSLSLFILEKTQDIPDRGDIIHADNADLVIEKMDGRKIDRVRILKKV